jgi:hypothetical protein
MRFEVFKAVKMWMAVFWFVTPCNLVGGYQRFGRTYCHHLHGVVVYLNLFNNVFTIVDIAEFQKRRQM